MPFIRYDEIESDFVTPKHSTAFGSLATGETIEVGRLSYKAGEGAEQHEHPQEQIMVVVTGRIRVVLGGETQELGPGEGYHAPSFVPHELHALTDAEVISCKAVINGVGHRI